MSSTIDQARQLSGLSSQIEYAVAADKTMEALGLLNRASVVFGELVADLIQVAYDNGVTKKRLTEILDLKSGDLRDLKKST